MGNMDDDLGFTDAWPARDMYKPKQEVVQIGVVLLHARSDGFQCKVLVFGLRSFH